MKKLIVAVLISLLAGCAGVDTLRISSVPDKAKVYVNGQYAGLTPYNLHSDYYAVFGYDVMGDRLHLTIDKEGYKTVEKDIFLKDRKARKGTNGDFSYSFPLEPLPANPSATK